jgi:hypothetical protein
MRAASRAICHVNKRECTLQHPPSLKPIAKPDAPHHFLEVYGFPSTERNDQMHLVYGRGRELKPEDSPLANLITILEGLEATGLDWIDLPTCTGPAVGESEKTSIP